MTFRIVKSYASKWKLLQTSIHQWLPTHSGKLIRRQSSTGLTWSYVSNPGTWPLLGLTLGQAVDRATQLFGDSEALVSVPQGIRKSFVEFKEEYLTHFDLGMCLDSRGYRTIAGEPRTQSERVAAGLRALGLEPGDRLGIWGPNSYEWVLTLMAAAKAGLILVLVNPAYQTKELEFCLNKVSIKALICDKEFKTSNYYKMLCELAPELPSSPRGHLRSARLPHLQQVIVMSDEEMSGTIRFKDLFEAGDSSHANAVDRLQTKIRFDDPCNIQFTSGTTGLPKAAILSHHNLINNGYGLGLRAEYHNKLHRVCLPVPLYHCFGCVGGIVQGLVHGSTSVLPSRGFDAEAAIQTVQDEKITSLYGTPTMFVDMLSVLRKNLRDVSSLSAGIMAGAPCPPDLVMSVINELNMKEFVVMYGMTETSPVSFGNFPSDPPSVRSSTIGYPLDHTEVKIADENGQVVPIGEAGEVCTRGYLNFLGYWGDPEKTKEIMGRDRWLKTGDQGVMKPNGYCQIIGRIKDMIIRGGENIYPTEIENFLMELPGILETQVFGVPDERMGEEVVAWVRKDDNTDLDEASLRQLCKGKIAHYKIPRYILFKESFPTTITGKIQKFKMREMTIEELNLGK